MIRQLDERTCVSGQIAADHVGDLAAQGFTVIVNNRPDGEEDGQPSASTIEQAAAAAGLKYHHIPIVRGIGPSDVEAMEEALAGAGDGKLLAFCRSGTRSAYAIAVARRRSGASPDEVERSLSDAGFDPGPIAHLL
ncbi:MAG TPA: TIGR01244 family sulfur transferase [Sphingomicrobium sp.]|jgi:uncharacterized protein (TIGR01244 family)